MAEAWSISTRVHHAPPTVAQYSDPRLRAATDPEH
jgi:hypothetical protein